MICKRYGATGIELSAIGFGGMRFRDQEDVDGCSSLVKAAYDAGINYFDTAPGYGKSEDLFGVAFKEMNKTRGGKPFYVSTKSMKSDPALVRKDLETSLKRMNLDHIDFYHMWCITSLDAYHDRKTRGVLKEFERLKEEGIIRHICVSSHMTGADIAKMLDDYPFEGVLCGYSVMNFAYRDAAVEAAAKLNRGVVVMNPLGGGVIPQHADRFAFVKTRADETVVQGALRFLVSDPRITVALVGLSAREQLAEAVSAVEESAQASPATVKKIRAKLRKAFNELCTSCCYCDGKCPQGIPVPMMMEAYNHYLLNKDFKAAIERMQYHWDIKPEENIAGKCTECGECEDACTQKLPIIRRLKEIQAGGKKTPAGGRQ